MAETHRPLSKENAPDPSRSYERARPEDEAGMGRLDNNGRATPTNRADALEKTVLDQQAQTQAGGKETLDTGHAEAAQAAPSGLPREQPDHSMLDEEPMGWDQAPQDISNPRAKRHPRTDGRGGTP